jgi:hypothetical protein
MGLRCLTVACLWGWDSNAHCNPMPNFARYIGVDHSGAEVANASLKALRVYCAEGLH